MAEAVVSSVVQTLGDLLNQEVQFLRGVKGQVEKMQIELNLMQSYLQDADKRQDEREMVRTCVSEIREAAYEAEAVIETFALKIASKRRGGIRNKFKRYACIMDEAFEIHRVGSKIEAITMRISNLKTSLQTYGITPISRAEGATSEPRTQLLLRRSYSHVVEEYTVGLDEDTEMLVAQLVNEEQNYGVVSICGMGGLGKTTLARKLYLHNEIRCHFEGFAWASISQQFQPRDVWVEVLFKLISPSEEQRRIIKELTDGEVARKLYEVQQEKKYLVILDDIWTKEAWDSLNPAFPLRNGSSKMLLTTRVREVAKYVDDGRGLLHEPRCLTEDESWELFQKKAFTRKDEPGFSIDTSMKELGKTMVERCAGLPLAIIVLGAVLATKYTLIEWKMVLSYFRTGKGHEEQNSKVPEVLALSYHELPYRLKSCFLHLGHFPEDYEIPTKKLARMWVAEGIVSPMEEGEVTVEDVAEGYLGELVDRSMVQVGKRGSMGRIKTCRLHDLMRDLCLLKAKEENFLKIAHGGDGSELVVSFPSIETNAESSQRVHRLAIYLGEGTYEKICWERERSAYLRSLLFFNPSGSYIRISEKMISMFTDFKMLKILDLQTPTIAGNFPRGIKNLIHLRYLGVFFKGIQNIPSFIGNLRWLQTLDMRLDGEVRIPNTIWNMERLRHLLLPCIGTLFFKSGAKLRMGNWRDLQTLKWLDIEIFDVKELTKLTNLKYLGIRSSSHGFHRWEGNVMLPSVTLNRLCSLSIRVLTIVEEETELQRLFSDCRNLSKLTLNSVHMRELPKYHQFFPKLTKLTLDDSQLEEDPMPTLEKLPYLTILRLCFHSFYGKEMVCSSKGFPQLKSLLLEALYPLEEWRVDEEAMPTLCELQISSCRNLKMVPDGLRFVKTLRELTILGMPEEFNKRLRVVNEGGGEDFYKVQHVPSIILPKQRQDPHMLSSSVEFDQQYHEELETMSHASLFH